jgi:hypothetical protein
MILIMLVLAFVAIIFCFVPDKTEVEESKEETYDEFLNNRRSEREERENENWKKQNVNHKIDKLFNLLLKDFINNPYSDKHQSLITNSSIISFSYKYENGYTFTLNDKEIRVYNRSSENISSYRLNDIYYVKFLKLILEIKENSYNRNYNSKYNQYKREQTNEDPTVKKSVNSRLEKINEKITLREDQLRKMRKNDPERIGLENELNTYRNIAEKIKSKNK